MTEVKLTSNGVEVIITGVTPPLFCTGGGGGTKNKAVANEVRNS